MKQEKEHSITDQTNQVTEPESVPARFERMVRANPQQLAIVCEDRRLTYDEVNRAANQIAYRLQTELGNTNEPVALLFSQTENVIIAMLGALKAGKIYCVIDPALPMDRRLSILADLATRCVLVDGKYAAMIEELPPAIEHRISFDETDLTTPDANLNLPLDEATLAAIYYSSGTTGAPKGITRDHKNLIRRAQIFQYIYRVDTTDMISLLYPAGYSSAMSDIVIALLNGAALNLFDLQRHNVHGLIEWIDSAGITYLHLHAAVLRQLLDILPADHVFDNLRCIRPSDRLYRRDIDRLSSHLTPQTIIYHSLASTETGPITGYVIESNVALNEDVIPVGYPLSDVDLTLVDEEGATVDGTGEGEIVVRGDHLSATYWRQPEMTAARFRPDPSDNGSRIVCTGDLARRRDDGALIWLARKDLRVKIRGYSVDLGVIESALEQMPGIISALVQVQPGVGGENTLAAWIETGGADRPITEMGIRASLGKQLADYMIPTYLVIEPTLPRLPNGKINHRALPPIAYVRPELDAPYAAPETPLERQVHAIWCDVLGLKAIGINDPFLDLGGHSLQATRVAARMQAEFGIELGLKAIFSAATIAEMAMATMTHLTTGAGSNAKQIDSRIVDLDQSIEPPRLEQRILLEEHLLETRPYKQVTDIPQRAEIRSAPLSFAQERLWFLDQLEPDSPAYNEMQVARLKGALNIRALEQSLDALSARHDGLRTCFQEIDGELQQVIYPVSPVHIRLIDLSSLSVDAQIPAARKQIEAVRTGIFDLTQAPLSLVVLVRLADDDHFYIRVTHHIISDGWSSGIFRRELSHYYGAFAAGNIPDPLPDLSFSYRDFAVWQRERLQGSHLAELIEYWNSRLAGLQPLNLPSDRPRPPKLSHRGGVEHFAIDRQLSENLATLARSSGATLYMLLLAAFQILLHRYSGQDDIAVGSPIANRTSREVEELLGFFVNTLVMRTDCSHNVSFRSLLAQVRQNALRAYDHQELPFEKLVEELRPSRDLNHNPLFDVLFALNNVRGGDLHLQGLTVERLARTETSSKFDLSISIFETEAGLKGRTEYATDLFDLATIHRMNGHFQRLLEAIVANPDCPIDELSLLGTDERHQLLAGWNDTATDFPKGKSLHQLFEDQVAQTPDAIAVVFDMTAPGEPVARWQDSVSTSLTYRELDVRANQLAHHLQAMGVGPNILVGICVERSLEMMVGLLGILKAGGAYVPLDPTYPSERLAFMLQDADVSVLLTQQHLCAALPATPAQQICLDTDWTYIAKQKSHRPQGQPRPHDLAYLIYTSGSTGQPKGVMISHEAIVNRLLWQQQQFQLTCQDRVLHKTPFGFDVSVWEIFWPLLNGATLVVAQPGGHKDPQYLVNIINQMDITTVHFVPSMLQQFVETADSSSCASLKRIVCSGEALSYDLMRRTLSRLDADLYNLYGPTETAVEVSYWRCSLEHQGQIVPIGRPIANTQLYIVDGFLQPVPCGVPGELLIGGVQVARGYHKRPELTAEKFIADPFLPQDSPGRLYKTGDLARWLPDGAIEFLGRIDRQIKIRGNRVELAEIEHTLVQHPAVSHAVVTFHEQIPGQGQLVAYAVGEDVTPPTLIDHLRRYLPDYMTPVHLMLLDTIPLTPNGKIDYAALPTPKRRTRKQLFKSPQTPTEQILADIWIELLTCDPVGCTDNFFELGGHSLTAMGLVTRINERFRTELPLRTVFETPVLGDMAIAIVNAQLATMELSDLNALFNNLK